MCDVFMAVIMTQVIVEPVELKKSPRLVRYAELIREEEEQNSGSHQQHGKDTERGAFQWGLECKMGWRC